MITLDLLGSIAGSLTTISFIPQVIQVVKTKSTKDISLGMFITFSLGVLSWFIYGIIDKSLSMTIANGIVFLLALVIIRYKLKYK